LLQSGLGNRYANDYLFTLNANRKIGVLYL
jgi:hypothetical protein